MARTFDLRQIAAATVVSAALCLVACGGGGGGGSATPTIGTPVTGATASGIASPGATTAAIASPGATALPIVTSASVASFTTAVTLGGGQQVVGFPNVGGYSGDVRFPASTGSGSLKLTVSTTAQVTQGNKRRVAQSQGYNPLLYFTATAAGALQQLVSQPGFDIVGANASNAVYWIAVFDPTNTAANVVLIGPGVPNGNTAVFQTSSVGPSFTTGQSYQFVLFSLPGTPPTPQPSSTSLPVVQEFSMPGAIAIANGPDGNLWVTACALQAGNNCNNATIAKVTTSGTSQIFQTGLAFGWTPALATAADGTLWGTAQGQLIDIATSGSVTASFASPLPVEPQGTTQLRVPGFSALVAQSHYVWAVAPTCACVSPYGYIEKFDTTTKAAVAVFPSGAAAGAALQAVPVDIASKSDGTVWFTEGCNNLAAGSNCYGVNAQGFIGEIAADSSLHEYPAPAGVQPFGITVGADGTVWFTEATGNNIGRVTSNGIVTEVPFIVSSYATSITTASDGTLWVASHAGLSQLTSTGVLIATYPTLGGWPYNLIQGPDGNIWYTASVQQLLSSQPSLPFPYFVTSISAANYAQTIGVLTYPGATTQSRFRAKR